MRREKKELKSEKRMGGKRGDRSSLFDWEDFCQKNPGAKIYYATTKGRHVYSDVHYEPDCFIMFGKESAGIPEEILKANPDTCVRIPMIGETRSLNLSNSEICGSKGICTYPQLFAAYHVRHRLQEPRHPPYALHYLLTAVDYDVDGSACSHEEGIHHAIFILYFFLLGFARTVNIQ